MLNNLEWITIKAASVANGIVLATDDGQFRIATADTLAREIALIIGGEEAVLMEPEPGEIPEEAAPRTKASKKPRRTQLALTPEVLEAVAMAGKPVTVRDLVELFPGTFEGQYRRAAQFAKLAVESGVWTAGSRTKEGVLYSTAPASIPSNGGGATEQTPATAEPEPPPATEPPPADEPPPSDDDEATQQQGSFSGFDGEIPF